MSGFNFKRFVDPIVKTGTTNTSLYKNKQELQGWRAKISSGTYKISGWYHWSCPILLFINCENRKYLFKTVLEQYPNT